LALRRGSVFRDLAEGGFAAAGITLDPAFEADYVGSLIGLADAGLGVAIVPGYAVALTDRSRSRWKRLEKPLVEREVLMVHRAGPTLSPAAQAFADFILKRGVLPAPSSGRRSPKRP
jgi:DNA-binding transcriptional LysR family regulator